MPKIPIALQLYSVREDTAKDFAGTVQKVAEIGYAAVELAGHSGLSVQDLSRLLSDNYLTLAGSHVGLEALEQDLPQVIRENLALGTRYVVVPFLAEARRQTADDYKRVAESLNSLGETLQTAGLTLAYHNHDFEFQPLENGQRGIDILLENTDPTLVKAEIDTYWVMKAGEDPVAFLQKHSGRVSLIHLKDMDPEDGSFAPVGTGKLPLDALVATAPEVGAEYLIVEQDICKGPALEAVALSYNNLKAKGYA